MARNRNDYMSIRIEKQLKEEFDIFCSKSGMTTSGAVNLLVRDTIKKKEIPFQITSVNDVNNSYNSGEAVRASIRVDKEVKDEFAKVCAEIGLPMSRIVKIFMLNCINTGRLPF